MLVSGAPTGCIAFCGDRCCVLGDWFQSSGQAAPTKRYPAEPYTMGCYAGGVSSYILLDRITGWVIGGLLYTRTADSL